MRVHVVRFIGLWVSGGGGRGRSPVERASERANERASLFACFCIVRASVVRPNVHSRQTTDTVRRGENVTLCFFAVFELYFKFECPMHFAEHCARLHRLPGLPLTEHPFYANRTVTKVAMAVRMDAAVRGGPVTDGRERETCKYLKIFSCLPMHLNTRYLKIPSARTGLHFL